MQWCLCPTDSEVKSCVDADDGSGVEIMDEFCYLGDGDASVTNGIRSGWF